MKIDNTHIWIVKATFNSSNRYKSEYYCLRLSYNGKIKNRCYPRTEEGLAQANIDKEYYITNGVLPPKQPKIGSSKNPNRSAYCITKCYEHNIHSYRLVYTGPDKKTKSRNYPRTEEGLAQAKSDKDYHIANGVLPPKQPKSKKPIKDLCVSIITYEKKYVLATIDNINKKSKNRTYPKTEEGLAHAKSDKEYYLANGKLPYNTAFSIRTKHIDPATPIYHVPNSKKAYVTKEEITKLHEILIKYVNEFVVINKYSEYGDKYTLPEIHKLIVDVITRIRLKFVYIKYRNCWGPWREKLLEDSTMTILKMLQYYKPSKGNPFTFLTIIVTTALKKIYIDLSTEASKNEKVTFCSLDSIAETAIQPDVYGNDEEDDENLSVAMQIAKDISKYVEIAKDIGMDFGDYLKQCKAENRIILQ